jgi:peptide/nickel transport system permease protein
MTRYVLKRLGLALITLALLSVIVFATAQLLPGDVGRKVLGPFAPQEAVDALNAELGADRSAVVQYVDWVDGLPSGDLGMSLAFQVPAGPLIWDAFVNSLKLAAFAFVIVVPIAILGGVVSGLLAGRVADRALTLTGISLTVLPEFVTSIVLIIVVGIWLDWLPITAEAPPGAGFFTELEYLLLPSIVLALVLFGYIARITRAGVVEALDADYTRTAYLKGLATGVVVRRHVLRNALLPTIAVVATQVGYLFGGLIVIERIFNYQGIGLLVLNAANNKDYPLLTSGVMVIGAVYLFATLVADLLYAALNPRIRFGAVE